MLQRPIQLVERIGTYPWWEVAIELAVIGVFVYLVVRFLHGTRAAGALKGLIFLLVAATLVVRILNRQDAFGRLTFLYENFLALLAITLIVVFQPELRRGLIRLGETPVFRRSTSSFQVVVESIVEACTYFAKAKFGAIIVIERETGLKGLVEGGTVMNAEVSARLLQTIFFPGSALHDLAVVIKGDRIVSAGVQLPLAEPADMPDAALGSRHRAAVGISSESDALVVVVSEETGTISLAERGRLDRSLSPDELRRELLRRLARGLPAEALAPTNLGRLGRAVTDSARRTLAHRSPRSAGSQGGSSASGSGGNGRTPHAREGVQQ
jgi:diadenylate cyclase